MYAFFATSRKVLYVDSQSSEERMAVRRVAPQNTKKTVLYGDGLGPHPPYMHADGLVWRLGAVSGKKFDISVSFRRAGKVDKGDGIQ